MASTRFFLVIFTIIFEDFFENSKNYELVFYFLELFSNQ